MNFPLNRSFLQEMTCLKKAIPLRYPLSSAQICVKYNTNNENIFSSPPLYRYNYDTCAAQNRKKACQKGYSCGKACQKDDNDHSSVRKHL